MKTLHLVRHGEPLSGWGDAAAEPDPGLSARGLSQAREAADVLWGLPEAERPSAVFTSPLRRCRETAAPFSERLRSPATVIPAVAEIPTPELLAPEGRAAWLREAMAGDWDGVEGVDGPAWRAGVVRALLGGGRAAVFTHFVAINAAVTFALGRESVLAFRPAPGSITTLRTDGERLELVHLGAEIDGAGRVL